VSELVLELQMEQTSVSKHLRVLRDAGLVTSALSVDTVPTGSTATGCKLWTSG
jgi:DNA-binding transcriptional ArsR family regulator